MAAPATRQQSQQLRVQSDAIAASLPPLLVQARRIAASVTLGSHGRRRAGIGDSFWQFRQYSTDDAPQSIDWRQSGKVDVVYVREREWVAAQTAALWCDTSPSMHYRSSAQVPTKAERAAVMVLALAELLVDAGERIIHLAGDGTPERAAAKAGRLAVAQMADTLAAKLAVNRFDHPTSPPAFGTNLPRHAAIVLVSDFLAPFDEIAASLRQLFGLGIRGHLLQVLDPAEETLPFSGRVRFVGLEKEGATVVDRAEDVRAAYTARLAAHREALRNLTIRAGWSFGLHHTDRSPQLAMAAVHNAITGHRR